MQEQPFDRSKHVYHSQDFIELVRDAVRFFNGTPVHPLPLKEKFLGTGVYAIYYTGNSVSYSRYGELNRLEYKYPIYIGKAVPRGWRQSRIAPDSFSELYSRLREHESSINKVEGIDICDFACRFVIFSVEGAGMIGSIEAALIQFSSPLWNSCLDGFGNHDPGKGRYNQARSDWDVVHPGRVWADKCTGVVKERGLLLSKVAEYMSGLEG